MNIIKSSTYMISDTSSKFLLETECLYGEIVEVLKEHHDWLYCKLLTDNYCGWVKKNSLGRLNKATHRVLNKRTFIYQNKSSKSNILLHLPMGSRLAIENMKDGWAETLFFFENKLEVGFVPCQHIVNNEHKIKDWVTVAQQLEGTPYKWGGRDTIGIDCSALLQLSYQTYGQIIPRNTSQQIKLKKKKLIKFII